MAKIQIVKSDDDSLLSGAIAVGQVFRRLDGPTESVMMRTNSSDTGAVRAVRLTGHYAGDVVTLGPNEPVVLTKSAKLSLEW